jgi:small subunit ribosomal protein S1
MPGITGLLPKSKISKSYDPASIEKLKEGDAITVKVEEINPKERRITLDVSDSTQGDGWKEFSKDQESPMGALGEKLMKALKDKE